MVTHVEDITSSSGLFILDAIQNTILDCTYLEGQQVIGEGWTEMDQTHLCAHFGDLILAGVFRSKGVFTVYLMDVGTGRKHFLSTISLENFQLFPGLSALITELTANWLAAIRTLWHKCLHRLPLFYNPGSNVTVDEQKMPFRGCYPFRQYRLDPQKIGIKIWAVCDAASLYAWSLQVYEGKPDKGALEKNQGMRVVLDMTQGLSGHITCNNFFTLHKLGKELQ